MFFDRKIGQVNDFMNLTSRRTSLSLSLSLSFSISTRRKCKNFDKYFQMETKHRDLHSFQSENRFFCKARRIFRSHASRVRKRIEKKEKEEEEEEEERVVVTVEGEKERRGRQNDYSA